MGIFYRPADAVAGDFIPLYHDGVYHLFYLKDYRDPAKHGEGMSWWHVATRDFVHFEERGEALPHGRPDEQDLYVFTGSALAAPDGFHIFYTGHNPHFHAAGRPQQVIMHATSPDLDRWTKQPGLRLPADPARYEPQDWRDPFVFWNEEAGEYWMLIAARKPQGPSQHKGATALATSPDLERWQVRDPFWAPDLYHVPECPDLFRLGDRYYLIFSEYSDLMRTRYRMSRTLAGPWLPPADDLFDDRAFYAAKSAGDGNRRFLFGWLPTREGDRDSGGWQWGGTLVVHEIWQTSEGWLAVKPPQSVLDAFSRPVKMELQPRLGSWEVGEATVQGALSSETDATGRLAVLALGEAPAECLLEMEIRYSDPTASLGILLRESQNMDRYYQLRLEPARGRLVFDRRPRTWDHPFLLERPLPLSAGTPISLRVVCDGSCLVAYVDGRVALSARMYDFPSGQVGILVSEGQASFSKISLKAR